MSRRQWNPDHRSLALGCLRNYTREQIEDMIQELQLGQAKDEAEPRWKTEMKERDEARADALYATENWQRCVKERDRALSVVARLRAELGQEPLTEGHEPDCKCTECGQAWLEANLEPSPTLKGER